MGTGLTTFLLILKISSMSDWMTLVVAKKNPEAEGIVSFELVDPNERQLPDFTAGSHLDVEVMPGVVRQYSLCNSPRDKFRYLIAVLHEPRSRGGSAALISGFNIGSQIKVSQPRNLFRLNACAARSILIAGGIGITPILSMAQHLSDASAEFELHYCARNRSRMAFYDSICNSSFFSKAHFHFDGRELTRFDLQRSLRARGEGDHLYVCGPVGLVEEVFATAEGLGWAKTQLHRELFVTSASPREDCDQEFEVQIARTGNRYLVPSGRTVMEVLEANGVHIRKSCEQGICGACLTRVLEGVPDHRDNFMTEAEHEANEHFTPCCSRAKSAVLVIDPE